MAVADKSKARASDSIMPADKLKPLLALSKTEPVQAAIALTRDGDALILLDKKVRPKKLASMLKARAAKEDIELNAATVRFGRAEVDPEYDPGMVRFWVNKAAPGTMRAKLVEVLKRGAFQKAEINVDETLEAEPEDAEADQATATAPPDPAALSQTLASLLKQLAARPAGDPARAALVKLAADANAALKAGNAALTATLVAQLEQEMAVPTRAGTMRAELESLARRIAEAAGGDGARRATLAKLAASVNEAIKSNDLAKAAEGLAQVRDALGDGSAPRKAGPDPKVAFAQARLRYDEGRKHVHAEVDKLMAAMREKFADEPDFAAISAAIEQFGGLRDLLDDRLMDELDHGYTAANDTQRSAARQAALAAIGDYQAFLAGNGRLLAGMDKNPFVPVSVESVLPPLLADLASQLSDATDA